MGIDYGTRRIGIALSDQLHITAQPFRVIDADDCDDELGEIVRESDVERIVVGMPTHLAGRNNSAAVNVRAFAERIGATTGLPVDYVDERFTTKTAESALIESNMSRRARKGVVDKVAAAVILQRWLDIQPRGQHGIV